MALEELVRVRKDRDTQLPAASQDLRNTGSLIRQVAMSVGTTLDQSAPEELRLSEPVQLPDGYVRRSPVQPYLTAAEYRKVLLILSIYVLAVHVYLAGGRSVNSSEDMEKCGLSRTRRSDDRNKIPLVNRK